MSSLSPLFTMNLISCLVLTTLVFCAVSCRSTDQKKETPETRETSRLGAVDPHSRIGGYYRLRRGMNGFYQNVPIFTQVLPDRYLMRGHIIQLLDPSVSEGWARVKNEDLEIGYVKFENIKIVAEEKQPRPKERGMDDELDQRMRSR